MAVSVLAPKAEGSVLRTRSVGVGADGRWLRPMRTGADMLRHIIDGDAQELSFTFKKP